MGKLFKKYITIRGSLAKNEKPNMRDSFSNRSNSQNKRKSISNTDLNYGEEFKT